MMMLPRMATSAPFSLARAMSGHLMRRNSSARKLASSCGGNMPCARRCSRLTWMLSFGSMRPRRANGAATPSCGAAGAGATACGLVSRVRESPVPEAPLWSFPNALSTMLIRYLAAQGAALKTVRSETRDGKCHAIADQQQRRRCAVGERLARKKAGALRQCQRDRADHGQARGAAQECPAAEHRLRETHCNRDRKARSECKHEHERQEHRPIRRDRGEGLERRFDHPETHVGAALFGLTREAGRLKALQQRRMLGPVDFVVAVEPRELRFHFRDRIDARPQVADARFGGTDLAAQLDELHFRLAERD